MPGENCGVLCLTKFFRWETSVAVMVLKIGLNFCNFFSNLFFPVNCDISKSKMD